MSILIDYNQVLLSNLFKSIGNHQNVEISEDMVRHMFLNSLRYYRKKFKNDYGELIICVDGRHSWRRKIFPYYKAARKQTREDSELDWENLFEIINNIRDELKDYFPYKVIHVEECEADDIIGVICHKEGKQLNNGDDKFLIISSDKDYIQLQKYSNVDQYDPINKKWVVYSDPDEYLIEHIIKGDRGDGIPNILSKDNCIVVGERQKPMTKKRLAEFKDEANIKDELKKRFERNRALIDLSLVPAELQDEILNQYNKTDDIGREKLFGFFMKKKLKNLMPQIQDF